MKIRSAQLSDGERIYSTHRASIEILCAGHYSADQIAKWVQVLSPAIYESAIRDKIMLVAEEDDAILGLGILDLAKQEIGAIYVHPRTAGAGTGKRILAELEQRASDNCLDHLTLCSTLNALGFYEKRGYAGSQRSFHELPNGPRLECVRMHKTLTNSS